MHNLNRDLRSRRCRVKWIVTTFTIMFAFLSTQPVHAVRSASAYRLEMCRERNVALEAQVEELKENLDFVQNTCNIVTCKHREANDEVVAIKAAVIEVMKMRHLYYTDLMRSVPARIRWMGAIDPVEWHTQYVNALDPRNPLHGYNTSFPLLENEAHVLARIRELLNDQDWHPFKVVVVDGKEQYEVERDDPKLVSIRNIWGDDICELVMRAMKELEEYNSSGRFPTPMPWDLEEDKPFHFAEVIRQFGEVMYLADIELRELIED